MSDASLLWPKKKKKNHVTFNRTRRQPVHIQRVQKPYYKWCHHYMCVGAGGHRITHELHVLSRGQKTIRISYEKKKILSTIIIR